MFILKVKNVVHLIIHIRKYTSKSKQFYLNWWRKKYILEELSSVQDFVMNCNCNSLENTTIVRGSPLKENSNKTELT